MKENDVTKQLDRVTEDFRFHFAERITIKKWCITVWVAVLISLTTRKLILSRCESVLLLCIPVIIFWILEAFQGAITIRRERMIRKLEDRLAFNNFESDNPIEIYFYSMDEKATFIEKLKDLRIAISLKGTLSFLYIALILLSLFYSFMWQ